MPRQHKHIPGTKYRRNYSLDNLELALGAVINDQLSFTQAAERYGVPKTTLYRKYRGLNSDRMGRPPVIPINEEKKLVEAMSIAADFGYPFTSKLIKEFMQQYLNRQGVIIPSFHNNLPGDDWLHYFEKRNPVLTKRFSENTKRCRAELTQETINQYFDELEKTLHNVPLHKILNYDETNICDDPGKQLVYIKRGSKHARRILDSSKSSTSVMFTICANGVMLPPYVVFKSKNLYPEWLEGGPPGTHFNRSKSGWFDHDIFEDWFEKIALPYLRKQNGVKVLIGDNLSSHASYKIIRLCSEHNIKFVFLPPNSTHIAQPLDVSVFRPLKNKWKQLLTDWKMKNRGVISKPDFTKLLKKLMINLEPTLEHNIKAGFASSGIVPLNRERVLQKLLGSKRRMDNNALTESFTNIMNEVTQVQPKPPPTKRKKINVPAGKSICLADIENDKTASTEEIATEETTTKDTETQETESQETEAQETVDDETRSLNNVSDEEDFPSVSKANEVTIAPPLKVNPEKNILLVDMFIVVAFTYDTNCKKQTEKCFVAQIKNISNKSYKVSCMRPYKERNDKFVFPNVVDEAKINFEQIKHVLSTPIVCRGIHTFQGHVL